MKKLLSVLLTLVLSVSCISISFADKYSDVSGHWAGDIIEKWSGLGIIKGDNGNFYPDENITRGEMAVIINRIMNFSEKSENTFSDLDDNFYTDSILALNKAEIMSGFADTIRPNDEITRQEAAVMIARTFDVQKARKPEYTFNDLGKIADWAYEYVIGMVNNGYMNGDNGNLNTENNITRAETVKLLDNIIGEIYSKAAEYKGNQKGICIVNADGVVLNGVNIDGDLIITDGIGTGKVILRNTAVSGRVIVKSGKDSVVALQGECNIGKVIKQYDNVINEDITQTPAPEVTEEPENTEEPAISLGTSSSSKPTPTPSAEPTTTPTETPQNVPTIETNIQDGMVQKGSKKVVDVWAKNTDGEKISCKLTLNGKDVAPTWDDTTKTSFTILFENEGENKIVVSATDKNGAENVKEYSVVYESADYGDVIGQSVWCIEAFTVGGGYIIAPVKADIKEGINAAQTLSDLLEKYNIESIYTGSVENGYYLSTVKNLQNFSPKISDVLKEKLEENSYTVNENDYNEGELGEFNFTQGSGWMYCVNGIFPNVGFSDYYLTDGDVVRVQFTLAYGADIGGTSAMGWDYAQDYFDSVDRDKLTAKIAEVGIDSCGEYMDTITKPNITQAEIDDILSKLK